MSWVYFVFFFKPSIIPVVHVYGGAPVTAGCATVMSRCITVLKMIATGKNRGETGGEPGRHRGNS